MSASPINVYSKDPNSVLDYTIDWTEWLGTDTIVAVTWTVPAGISNSGTVRSNYTATIFLSGGTVNTNYVITCQVITSGGRTDERSIQINVVDR
jgi:hypothetical protein